MLYYLNGLCTLYYGVGIAMLLIIPLIGVGGDNTIIKHGKTMDRQVYDGYFGAVSKRLFSLFYLHGIVGMLVEGFVVGDISLIKIMVLLHLIRRFVECKTFEYSENSKMHPIHFLVGISYYPILVTSLSLEGGDGSGDVWFCGIFSIISAMQSYCHYLLWKIRKIDSSSKNAKKDYSPLRKIYPTTFGIVLCPHYSLEIVLYLLVVMWSKSKRLLMLNLIFTALNLRSSASNTGKWYEKRFPTKNERQKYPKLLVPFLY